MKPEDARIAAMEAAKKALQYDFNLPDGYISRAYVKLSYEWDLAGAREDFKRGIELDPQSATAHHWFSHYYMAVGDLDKAMAEMKRAQQLEPLSPSINNGIGLVSSITCGNIKKPLSSLNMH
jgi:tetratricopeptide (TPR) repeat protein